MLPDSTVTILIIDDTPANLALLFNALSKANMRVLVAESVASAFARLQHVTPDLILLDVMMPEVDGYECCRRLKAEPTTSEIPVIFLTALTDTVDLVRAFAAGGVDYITKPIRLEEVFARVETHLTLHRLRTELKSANARLEERVHQRTTELEAEVTQRKKSEAEKSQLLEVVRHQSEQLYNLTAGWIDTQQKHRLQFEETLNNQVAVNLTMMRVQLELLKSYCNQLEEHRQLKGNRIPAPIAKAMQLLFESLTSTSNQIATISQSLQASSSTEQKMRENPLFKLSTREREVLQLLVEGKSYTEIAQLLVVTESTVRTHRNRINEKLGITDTATLVKFAIRNQLIKV